MYSKAMMLFLLTETPLHAGSGREVGAVDLPIQRERVTRYPLIQATGVKGKLRAEAYATSAFRTKYEPYRQEEEAKIPSDTQDQTTAIREAQQRARRKAAQELGVEAVFGPDWDNAEEHAGSVSPTDAKILLFPVRSLAGVFAWVTSANVLARINRDITAAVRDNKLDLLPIPDAPDCKNLEETNSDNVPDCIALVAPNSDVVVSDQVVLEEYSYTAQQDNQVFEIGNWLAKNALPIGDEYDYWRKKLPRSLVILPESDFCDFTQYGTEIVTRIRIEDETKTVAKGALWTEENLPADTLLYSVVYANTPSQTAAAVNTAEEVLTFVQGLSKGGRLQLGGNEMAGRGLTAVRYGEVFNV